MIHYLRSDGVRGKTFAPRPLVSRVMKEIKIGMSPYFVPMDKETKGTRTFNRLVIYLSYLLTYLFTAIAAKATGQK